MLVRVLKPFKDKITKVIYQKGQEIELTKERYEELSSSALGSFVEGISDTPEPQNNKQTEQAEEKEPEKPKNTKKSGKKNKKK